MDRLLTVRQTADLLGVSQPVARRIVKRINAEMANDGFIVQEFMVPKLRLLARMGLLEKGEWEDENALS